MAKATFDNKSVGRKFAFSYNSVVTYYIIIVLQIPRIKKICVILTVLLPKK